MNYRLFLLSICAAVFIAAGCDVQPSQKASKPEPIIGKTTQDIGEFDPNADLEISDGKIEMNLITGAAGAYGPMVEKVSNIAIVQAVNLFNGFHGRYPKDHDEFMTEVIKKNNIRLPMLPHGSAYQYDVQNHALVVVKVKKDAPGDQ